MALKIFIRHKFFKSFTQDKQLSAFMAAPVAVQHSSNSVPLVYILQYETIRNVYR